MRFDAVIDAIAVTVRILGIGARVGRVEPDAGVRLDAV